MPEAHLRQSGTWNLWIDTGGTFTDCVAQDSQGESHIAKVLSTGTVRSRILGSNSALELTMASPWALPDDFFEGCEFKLPGDPQNPRTIVSYDASSGRVTLDRALENIPDHATCEINPRVEAPILAAHWVTRTPFTQPLPDLNMRLATTRGTNALLERKGAPVALFVTRGFGDLLTIRSQQRPELFALNIVRPEPLAEVVVEVEERLDAQGSIVRRLDLELVRRQAKEVLESGAEAAAVALLHSYVNPDHERAVAEILRDVGFRYVSCSAELAPRIKLLPRAETAVVNAYLAEILGTYLEGIAGLTSNGSVFVLSSSGSLLPASAFQAKDSLLSGPAGGVVGAAQAGRRAEAQSIIAFDMGGTSTDVSRVELKLGKFEIESETTVGDIRLMSPSLAIDTVAAGGGSICDFVHGELRVGPKSAGSTPGPACYGAGGPLTITDVNLLLGRLSSDRFEIPIDAAAAQSAADLVFAQVRASGRPTLQIEEMLEGFLKIANERMAEAIRGISIRQGYKPDEYDLVTFGGAGGQHACAVAENLGIDRILVPIGASLLSAYGLGAARVQRFAEAPVLQPLTAVLGGLADRVGRVATAAVARVVEAGVAPADVVVMEQAIFMRLVGQESSLEIDFADTNTSLEEQFRARYLDTYGYLPPEGIALEVESIRVAASSAEPEQNTVIVAESAHPSSADVESKPAQPQRHEQIYLDGTWASCPRYNRLALQPKVYVDGPALIEEVHTATFVQSGWRGSVNSHGDLRLNRLAQLNGEKGVPGSRPQPSQNSAVDLELFTHRFLSIAKQTGAVLQRTAMSVNVKERLDYSCGILDRDGSLAVNAPHIPVHLGALGLCVRTVREVLAMAPGDVIVTNHPAYGGSHLPDITVITPVFVEGKSGCESPELLGYVASRAHHAEIGGTRPGSMPPNATSLIEEGVVLLPQYLIRGGEARWESVRHQLESALYPSRAIEENLADLAAAVAANHRGMRALQKMAEKYGGETVQQHLELLSQVAEEQAREALGRFPDGTYSAEEFLDDGSPLRVRIDLLGGRGVIDFAGSAPVHAGNLNATPAIVRSAVLYFLRLVIGRDLPLNEGFLRAVEIKIPPGILNPPFPEDLTEAPAVVGGNVETSQRVVDSLLKALEVVACSQGTMNNFLFGSENFSYYETIAGGTGAGDGFSGASGVQSHMTNTAITDPEILEHRYPVRVERFALRPDSGGAGEYRGGDGTIREIYFKEGMSVSLLSQHRSEGPYGLAGGERGRPGKQYLIRQSGETESLDGIDACEVQAGDIIVIETPGGGGWGAPP